MRRGRRTDAKIELEKEEEDPAEPMVFEISSDDEEANMDLSLEIVEKARRLESKSKREEDLKRSNHKRFRSSNESEFIWEGGDEEDLSVENVENARKCGSKRKRKGDLGGFERRSFRTNENICPGSVSPSDENEFIPSGEDAAVKDTKIKKQRRSKKKKEKEKVSKVVDKFDNNAHVEGNLRTSEAMGKDAVEMFDNDMKAEENLLAVEDVDVEGIGLLDNVVNLEPLEGTESKILKAIGTSDNVVLRKLLRGPRYFDAPDNHWDACHNCGKEGHHIANCTEEKRKKPCFVCGKFGHSAKNCTQGQDCYICKRRGHIAKNCPEKHQVSSQSSKICLRCGDSGHDMSSCSNDYALEDLKEIQCYICKRFGHLFCADIIDNGPRIVFCYNCGQPGHMGSGCRKAHWEASSMASPTLCYKCGEEGHFAWGCSNSAKSRNWIGEPAKSFQRLPKAHKKVGFRSVPHDIGKIHKKRTPSSGKNFKTTGKSKQRGGWCTDDPGDMPNRKGKVNGWMSPTTPVRNGQTAARWFSRSRSPLRKHKDLFATPSSLGSPRPSMHKFSASRFGNNQGRFWRA